MCKKTKKLTKLLNAKVFCFALVLIGLVSNTSFGQSITWQKILNNSYGTFKKVQQTSDGGYIGIGSDRINNEFKIYFTKLDGFGATLWTRIIGIGYAHGNWVEETNDKGFIIGGYSDSAVGNAKVYLVKTDSIGNVIWQRYFINSDLDQCNSVKQTSDNGFILACRTQIGIINGTLLIKTDSLGNLQWQRVYSSFPRHRIVREIEVLNDGYILVGSIYGSGASSSNILALRVDLNGDSLWQNEYGGSDFESGYAIDNVSPNYFILGGSSSSFNSNLVESYLIKINLNGNVIWQRTYSGNYDEECYAVKYKPGLGYVLAGYMDTNNSQYTNAMIKIVDTNGTIMKQRTYFPIPNGGWFNDIELTDDEGYILGGGADNNSFNRMYIIKTDSLLDANPIGIPNNNQNLPTDYSISQNFPNPFNPVTAIIMKLKRSANVKILIYDVTGKLILELTNKNYLAGNYTLNIDFENLSLSSGIFFYSVFLDNLTLPFVSKKMIFLK